MDFNWVSSELFWVQEGDGVIYNLNTATRQQGQTNVSTQDVTNIAADPHNG